MGKDDASGTAGVRLTHPGKVLFADAGVTKADLARHYRRVAERMVPLARKRLVSLVRCPQGADDQCFFQRHGGRGLPDALKRMKIAERDGGRASYLYFDGLSGLIACAQVAALEIHIWGSRIDRLERPDRLVFDLDPDDALDFAAVRRAAFAVRARLDAVGLWAVPMVTGGKGIHVVAPLERRAEWPAVKAFARAVAENMAADAPRRFVAEAGKTKRAGRVFIDYLRNDRSATAIAPYSTRARSHAPVAMPVSWRELEGLTRADGFRIGAVADRLEHADPWAESARWRQSVTRAMLASVGVAPD